MTALGGLKGGSTVMLYVTGNPWSIAVQVSVAEVVFLLDPVMETLNVFSIKEIKEYWAAKSLLSK